MDEIALQRRYYAETSHAFDAMHLGGSEHVLACHLLAGFLMMRWPSATILDVGAGTGRFLRFARERKLEFQVIGVEPSDAQRKVGYEKGIPPEQLIEGDARTLQFPDDHFDFCTEFGVLHHIRDYERALHEMCRVASKGVFLSDSNNFGQGNFRKRAVKRVLRIFGLWKLSVLVQTKGRGYSYADGDGIFYSFTIFDCVRILKCKFPNIYIWSTKPLKGNNLFFGAEHVAILAHR